MTLLEIIKTSTKFKPECVFSNVEGEMVDGAPVSYDVTYQDRTTSEVGTFFIEENGDMSVRI